MMLSSTQHPYLEKQYFERMLSSLGDKRKLVEHLPPVTASYSPTVLDVGAGGGDFSYMLTQLGYTVTAVDVSEDAINHIQATYPNVLTAQMFNDEVEQLGVGKFDAVVCSSILHEVFSYGDSVTPGGHYESISRALTAFHSVLKPGGVLAIRDGVLPNNWFEVGEFTITPDEAFMVQKYLDMCPFANGTFLNENDNIISLAENKLYTFTGNIRSILEFCYTFTWGEASYPRETQEMYAVHTLSEYSELISEHNFTMIHAESHYQDGYGTHLDKFIMLNIPNVDNWFDTNAIWVAKKN